MWVHCVFAMSCDLCSPRVRTSSACVKRNKKTSWKTQWLFPCQFRGVTTGTKQNSLVHERRAPLVLWHHTCFTKLVLKTLRPFGGCAFLEWTLAWARARCKPLLSSELEAACSIKKRFTSHCSPQAAQHGCYDGCCCSSHGDRVRSSHVHRRSGTT